MLSNEFKGNQRLPSESELCIHDNVSRATVRQALSEMVREGLISRDQGRGSFVTDGVGLRRLSLKGTIENLIAAGEGSRIEVVEYGQGHPPPNMAEILKMGATQRVYQLGLVRSIPKGTFEYSFIYFPASLGEIISPEELDEMTEITTFVEENLRRSVHRAN